MSAHDHAEDIVIAAQVVTSLVTHENSSGYAAAWDPIIARGDARFALDDGSDIEIPRLALLAEVSERTVRNAVSAGELSATKYESTTFVRNASARKWLIGRRGWVPTRVGDDHFADSALEDMSSATALASFLRNKRVRLGKELHEAGDRSLYSVIDADALRALEQGSFLLPLSAIGELASFYEVPDESLLPACMRAFFPKELSALQSIFQERS